MSKKRRERQKAHSWMRLYVNRRTADYRGHTRGFCVKCRYVDVAQSHIRPRRESINVLDGTYTLIIDNIEYTLDGNNDTAVKDALKLHEAFYEEEFVEGGIRTANVQKDLNRRWIYLKGISTRWRRSGDEENTDYVQYNKATSIKVIAKWIATTLTMNYLTYNLSNMILFLPDGTKFNLRSFTDDVVPHEEFELTDSDQDDLHYYYGRWADNRKKANLRRKEWIAKKTEEICKDLDSGIKARKMVDDYKQKQSAA